MACRALMVAAGCLFFSCGKTPNQVVVADYLISERLTTGLDSVDIRRVADTILHQTKWQGKIRINRPYDENYINMYVIDGGDPRVRQNDQAAQLIANCSYAGANIIFLDIAYLRTFLNRHHVSLSRDETVAKEEQQCFLYWVIGHELGHFVCGHLQGHFDSGSLDNFVKNASFDNRDELQADSFFVQSIVPRDELRSSEQSLMMSILNAEIEQKVGKVQTAGVGIIFDYTNKQIVTFSEQPTHPEYVVRLSRMLELSAKMSKDEGLYNLVSSFIIHMKQSR